MQEQYQRIAAYFFYVFTYYQRKIENSKLKLARINEFQPYAMYQRIDRKRKARITLGDIVSFMYEHSQEDGTVELQKVFDEYDSEIDNKWSYKEFLNFILPYTCAESRQLCLDREPYRIAPGESLPLVVESIVVSVLHLEAKQQREMDKIRKYFNSNTAVLDLHSVFLTVSGGTSYIDQKDLCNFLHRNTYEQVTEADVNLALYRLLKSRNLRIDYPQFNRLLLKPSFSMAKFKGNLGVPQGGEVKGILLQIPPTPREIQEQQAMSLPSSNSFSLDLNQSLAKRKVSGNAYTVNHFQLSSEGHPQNFQQQQQTDTFGNEEQEEQLQLQKDQSNRVQNQALHDAMKEIEEAERKFQRMRQESDVLAGQKSGALSREHSQPWLFQESSANNTTLFQQNAFEGRRFIPNEDFMPGSAPASRISQLESSKLSVAYSQEGLENFAQLMSAGNAQLYQERGQASQNSTGVYSQETLQNAINKFKANVQQLKLPTSKGSKDFQQQQEIQHCNSIIRVDDESLEHLPLEDTYSQQQQDSRLSFENYAQNTPHQDNSLLQEDEVISFVPSKDASAEGWRVSQQAQENQQLQQQQGSAPPVHIHELWQKQKYQGDQAFRTTQIKGLNHPIPPPELQTHEFSQQIDLENTRRNLQQRVNESQNFYNQPDQGTKNFTRQDLQRFKSSSFYHTQPFTSKHSLDHRHSDFQEDQSHTQLFRTPSYDQQTYPTFAKQERYKGYSVHEQLPHHRHQKTGDFRRDYEDLRHISRMAVRSAVSSPVRPLSPVQGNQTALPYTPSRYISKVPSNVTVVKTKTLQPSYSHSVLSQATNVGINRSILPTPYYLPMRGAASQPYHTKHRSQNITKHQSQKDFKESLYRNLQHLAGGRSSVNKRIAQNDIVRSQERIKEAQQLLLSVSRAKAVKFYSQSETEFRLFQQIRELILFQREISLILNQLLLNKNFTFVRIFRKIDREAKGTVSSDQFLRALRHYGVHPSQDQTRLLLQSMQCLHKGVVNFNNFCEVFNPYLYYFGHKAIKNVQLSEDQINEAFGRAFNEMLIFFERVDALKQQLAAYVAAPQFLKELKTSIQEDRGNFILKGELNHFLTKNNLYEYFSR